MRANIWCVAKCKVCRKEIVIRNDWGYKVPNGNRYYYFCSWNHLREWTEAKERKRKTRVRGLKRGENVGWSAEDDPG